MDYLDNYNNFKTVYLLRIKELNLVVSTMYYSLVGIMEVNIKCQQSKVVHVFFSSCK